MADTMKKTATKRAKAVVAPVEVPTPADAAAVVALSADIAALDVPTQIETPAVELPAIHQKDESMSIETNTQNTVADATQSMTDRAQAAFGDATSRAKAAFEKGRDGLNEVVEFNRGTVEAMVQSARVAAKGWQDIAAYTVDYGRGAIETANANTRRLYAVKSPTEFVQVQTEIAKATLDEAVAQTSKFTENYLKLVGEIVQPLSNRYALAAERVKTAVAA